MEQSNDARNEHKFIYSFGIKSRSILNMSYEFTHCFVNGV